MSSSIAKDIIYSLRHSFENLRRKGIIYMTPFRSVD